MKLNYLLLWAIFMNLTIQGILAQAPTFEEETLLVKLEKQDPTLAKTYGASLRNVISDDGWQIWDMPSTLISGDKVYSDLLSMAKVLMSDSLIMFAEPNYAVSAFDIFPNDPDFNRLYGLHNTGQQGGTIGADIQAPAAWEVRRDASNVVVGVIDTGIDWTHPDLINNIWQNLGEDIDNDGRVLEFINGRWRFDPDDQNGIDDDNNGYVDDFVGWDFANDDNNPFDDHSHGTHVAGTIGMEGNNGVGGTGVCWSVQLMALKFLTEQGNGYVSDAIEALRYANMMGVDLTNNSWGGGDYSHALVSTIQEARVNGQLFVAAAGNSSLDVDRTPMFPAAYHLENIISVGASNNRDLPASYSNFGRNRVDFFAPGSGIYSTVPGGQYATFSGTSMAAPHVAGAVALMLDHCPFLASQPITLKNQLIFSGDRLPALAGMCVAETRLNLRSALNCSDPSDGYITFQRTIRGQRLNPTDAYYYINAYDIVQRGNGDYFLATITDFDQSSSFEDLRPTIIRFKPSTLQEEGFGTSHRYTSPNFPTWINTIKTGTDYPSPNEIYSFPGIELQANQKLAFGWPLDPPASMNHFGPNFSFQIFDLPIIEDRAYNSSLETFRKAIPLTESISNIYDFLIAPDQGKLILNDSVVLKTTADAAVEWGNKYSVIGDTTHLFFRSASSTTNGYFLLAGAHKLYGLTGPGAGKTDIIINKVDFEGEILWTKALTAYRDETVSDIIGTQDGGAIIVGNTDSYDPFLYQQDIYITKLDTLGAIEWTKVIGGQGLDSCTSVAQTEDGNYIVSGMTESFGFGGRDGMLMMITSEGDLEWAYTYGGTGDDQLTKVIQTIDGGFATVGYKTDVDSLTWPNPTTAQFAFWIKTDPFGNTGCAQVGISPVVRNGSFEERGLDLQIDPISFESRIYERNDSNEPFATLLDLIPDSCESNLCDVRASFNLDEDFTCESSLLLAFNQSINANSFRWLVNGTQVSTAEDLAFEFDSLGFYEIQLIAEADFGCRDTASQYLAINTAPIADLGPDTSACARGIRLAAPISEADYFWYDEYGNLLGNNQVFVARNSGLYTLEVSTECGLAIDSINVTITGDCVWPGDAFPDGIVNIRDYLFMASYHNTQGLARPNPSTDWIAQPAIDWSNFHQGGINFKHLDADGDGRIDQQQDGEIIDLNKNSTHAAGATSLSSNVNIRLDLVNAQIRLGDTMFFDIYVENININQDNQINPFNGLGLHLEYNLPFSTKPRLNLNGSALGQPNTGVAGLVLHNPEDLSFDIGLAHLNPVDLQRTGRIARMGIIITIDEIGDSTIIDQDEEFFVLHVSNPILLDHLGNEIPVNAISTTETHTVIIDIKNPRIDNVEESLASGMKVWPNPTVDQVNISWKPNQKVEKIEVLSWTGKLIQTIKPLSKTKELLSLANEPNGIYLLRIITEDNIYSQKIIKE